MTFRTTILTAGKTATGIQVPDEIVAHPRQGPQWECVASE